MMTNRLIVANDTFLGCIEDFVEASAIVAQDENHTQYCIDYGQLQNFYERKFPINLNGANLRETIMSAYESTYDIAGAWIQHDRTRIPLTTGELSPVETFVLENAQRHSPGYMNGIVDECYGDRRFRVFLEGEIARLGRVEPQVQIPTYNPREHPIADAISGAVLIAAGATAYGISKLLGFQS